MGAQVRKGEKSSYVVFYKELEFSREADDGASTETETRLFARATPVFAAEQVEGFELPGKPEPTSFDPIAAADALVEATGAVIHHGGSRAYYRPSSTAFSFPRRAILPARRPAHPRSPTTPRFFMS